MFSLLSLAVTTTAGLLLANRYHFLRHDETPAPDRKRGPSSDDCSAPALGLPVKHR